jgi:hypothetical protein
MSTPTGDSIKRQTEINEWSYHSRLETLFILQLLFLGMSSLIFLSILASYEIISPYFVGYYTVCVLIVLATVWYFKRAYNNGTRDPNEWGKRRFPNDGALSSNLSMETRQALVQSAIVGAASKCT